MLPRWRARRVKIAEESHRADVGDRLANWRSFGVFQRQADLMLTLRWKTLSGSYLALMAASRSYLGP